MMTRQQIAALPAGKELDALIFQYHAKLDPAIYYVPAYSNQIDSAWRLLAGKGWIIQEDTQCIGLGNRWAVFEDYRALEDYQPLGEGATAEVAICHAYLVLNSPLPAPSLPIDKNTAL